ncbi:MAG: HAD hydrolase-like protein [Lentisphaeria bacterium]|nr:HAD hydrolase-like protein [Lentisphaeria bacterium]
MDYAKQLRDFPRKHDFILCFDSDGCVFDTMELKHKECFCPAFIKHMRLQAASKYAREIWDFVNLYGKTRGCNRFWAVKHALDWARKRSEIAARGVEFPDLSSLESWLAGETKLGGPALETRIRETGDRSLQVFLDWSNEVNARIADMVYGIAPFPRVKDVLIRAADKADLMVVSQTPLEALEREWAEHGMDGDIGLIAGQEHGTKSEHIALATADKGYAPAHVLMVGDAPGDLAAAQANYALFFPILPGREEASWREFAATGLDRFFAGTFAGGYQEKLIQAFDAALPETPDWD